MFFGQAFGRYDLNWFKAFFARLSRNQTTTYAASVAFYTSLSLAPVLIIFVSLTSQMSPELQQTLEYQASTLVGMDAAQTVSLIVSGAKGRVDLASWSGALGVIALFLSAGLFFGELREAMNRIFDAKTPQNDDETILQSVMQYGRDRLLQSGLALGFILLMIASLVVSSVLASVFRSDETIWPVMNVAASFVFYVGMFTFVFRYLPDCRTNWMASFQGGFLTAFLFVVGKEVIAFYLGQSAIGSSYGAAGSVVVLLAWVYYSALITFVGANVSAELGSRE